MGSRNVASFRLATIWLVSCLAIPSYADDKAAAREAYCNKLPTKSETAICLDRDLTRRDGELNDVYQELKEKLKPAEYKDLQKEQRSWLAERNTCGADVQCLATQYTDRISVLEHALEGLENPGKSHVEIGCRNDQDFMEGECVDRAGAEATAPAPDPDMRWQVNAFNDPTNKGRYTVRLAFGIPETDAVQFDASCSAGSSAATALVIMGYNVEGMREGKRVKVNYTADGARWQLDGEVYGTELEIGVSGILVRPGFNNPFWEHLAGSSSQFSYRTKGGAPVQLGLKGSGVKVRKFIADCKAVYAASNTPSSADSGDTATNKTCDAYASAKSQTSETPVTITFVNKTEAYRSVMWIDFDGMPKDYANLDPGQSFTVNTYLTHPWMFTDGPGNCIEMFMPQAGVTTFEISAPSPAFGPEND